MLHSVQAVSVPTANLISRLAHAMRPVFTIEPPLHSPDDECSQDADVPVKSGRKANVLCEQRTSIAYSSYVWHLQSTLQGNPAPRERVALADVGVTLAPA